jgi:Zn-dependent protease with chaperone function
MDNTQFAARVPALEELARTRPRIYRLRVVLFALLGYGYLGLILLLLLALLVASLVALVVLKAFAFKLVIVLGGFVTLIVRALWVVIPEPRGLPLRRTDAPVLFERLEQWRRQVRAPRFHRVLVTDEFNAGVVQKPRLGLFGWQRNYLLLGLPLLKCLSTAQCEAVIAHEMGHLAGGHARFGTRLYRLRMMWTQLRDELDRHRSRGAFLFQRFFDWYVPRFNAYTFPLARANEYEADRLCAQLTSSRSAAEALTGVKVIGQYLGERFWPGILARADEEPQPTALPYSQLGHQLGTQIVDHDVQRWLGAAIGESSCADDTHPSLSQRLQALGESARFAPPEPGDSAAEWLLGAARTRIESYLDTRWQGHIVLDWRKRFDEVRAGREKLAVLCGKAQAGELGADEAFERVLLEESYGAGAEVALEQLSELHARLPDAAGICYALGLRLLQRGSHQGVALMEQAMQGDENAVIAALRALCDWYRLQGDANRANELHARLISEIDERDAAQAERRRVTTSDTFDAHGLDDAAIAVLRDQLAGIAELTHAYLARKRVLHRKHQPCLLLGFTTKRWWWQRHDAARAARVQSRILEQVTFSTPSFVFCVEGRNRKFARKLRSVEQSLLL